MPVFTLNLIGIVNNRTKREEVTNNEIFNTNRTQNHREANVIDFKKSTAPDKNRQQFEYPQPIATPEKSPLPLNEFKEASEN